MLVKKVELPTEGVKINGIHFKPVVEEEVSDEIGKLLKKKGYVEVKPKKKKEDE